MKHKNLFITLILSIIVFFSTLTLVACDDLDADNNCKHKLGEWQTTELATCNKTGIKQRFCSECTYKESAIIPVTSHKFIDNNCIFCNKTLDFDLKLTSNYTYSISAYKGYEETVSIPSAYNGKAVTDIGNYAFRGCITPKNIVIPDSITTISNGAFLDCKNFINITLPDSIISIGDNAFKGCTGLTKFIIPKNTEHIGIGAFSKCTGISKFTIPEKVASIGKDAFEGCSTLSIIEWNAVDCTYNGESNFSIFTNCDRLSSITTNKNVKSIPPYTFANCTKVQNVTLNNGLESVGYCAFQNCTSLQNIVIPTSVTIIGSGVFSGCENLMEISLPFVGDDNKSSARFGYIFASSIYDYNNKVPVSLKKVNITNSTEIVNFAFSNCTGIENITIPANVTRIGESAFSNCLNLKSITFTGNTTRWNSISKYSTWNQNTGDFIIHCTDGDLDKNGNEI